MNELLKELDMKTKTLIQDLSELCSRIEVLQAMYEQSKIELQEKDRTIGILVEAIASQMDSQDRSDAIYRKLFGNLGAVVNAHLMRGRKIEAMKVARAYLSLKMIDAKRLIDARMALKEASDG